MTRPHLCVSMLVAVLPSLSARRTRRLNAVTLVDHQNVTSFEDPVLNDGHPHYDQVR